MKSCIAFFALYFLSFVYAYNFPWEGIQLTETETKNYTEIQFANASSAFSNPTRNNTKQCKTYPGDAEWPTDAQWTKFNDTLGGVLIKPVPLAAPCYAGPYYDAGRCDVLKDNWFNARFHIDDPTSIMTQWGEGNTCLPDAGLNGTCTIGGYPVYVVNASTVRHVQMAVNFARNQNIRLVIKNTGHDFNGKSTGAGALSIWTHHLKDLEYLSNFNTTNYTGRAVRLSAGIESFDLSRFMVLHNFTMVAPGGSTVGALGGFAQGGGHSVYTSYYGLAADQIVSMQVVTADGRFVTVDSQQNEDLFWAIRGGGGGTFGVVTSAIMKAYPQTPISVVPVYFTTVPFTFNGTTIPGISTETFWKGIYIWWKHVIRLCDAGGIGYNFIRHTTPIAISNNTNTTGGLTFTTSFELPGMNRSQATAFAAPFFADLAAIGINLTVPSPPRTLHYKNYYTKDVPLAELAARRPSADVWDNRRLATRLFPRSIFEDAHLLNHTHAAIRSFVEEGGYTFHGINYSPTLNVSGNPDNAVLPALRHTVMHAEGFDRNNAVGSLASMIASHDRLQSYVQKWRDLGSDGSYMNEADCQEPDWQEAFFGSNYGRLDGIKRRWDPWGLFYAPASVGSQRWVVRSEGYPRLWQQNGRLCRVDGDSMNGRSR